MPIEIGSSRTATTTVDSTNVASAIGSGEVDVFSTPMMIALMELAAARCIEGFLEPGQVSVGAHVDVSHSGATPMGMQVTATATVTGVDRRRVEFAVVACDEAGEVGRGHHTRFIIDLAKFMQKTRSKKD